MRPSTIRPCRRTAALAFHQARRLDQAAEVLALDLVASACSSGSEEVETGDDATAESYDSA